MLKMSTSGARGVVGSVGQGSTPCETAEPPTMAGPGGIVRAQFRSDFLTIGLPSERFVM